MWTALLVFLFTPAHAEKAAVKVEDIPTSDETSITIQKGKSKNNCTAFEIVDGREDVFGMPEYDKSKSMASWKAACQEWRTGLKELNKENRIIALNCGQPSATKESDQYVYKSSATYKVRVKTIEP